MKRITGNITMITCCCILFAVVPFAADANSSKLKQNVTEASDPPATVEIVSFSGQSAANNKKIDLFCKIKSNCCYNIIVERSSNGKRFSAIATLSDNKQIAEFALSDNNPLRNTNYYRLKIADNKGNVKYSKTMVVQLYQSDDLSMVSVTPNTALKDLHINVQLKNRAYIVMKVTDEKGREVIKRKGAGNEGLNTYELEGTGTMSPGNYFLEVLINSKDLLSMPLVKG
ncbi:hypothetical protein [Agriterribacter sp.]|uniref:hypothetical protein n=1 Tax=Agriterribacter sp. TaxID=2821509 RepID=UPI002B8339C8|nr:hypothetical protein [Agriterribacter sp.]HRO45579.1 hypothetical protein [Agriterribacter sp.]HRQ17225.1 hypothetical protein [Agriterribacter sp.]